MDIPMYHNIEAANLHDDLVPSIRPVLLPFVVLME